MPFAKEILWVVSYQDKFREPIYIRLFYNITQISRKRVEWCGRRDIHIEEPFPVIFDGGYSVVTLSVDYESRRVLSARCNGVA